MNSDVAAAAAYRPEDHAKVVENRILNAFEDHLRDVRRAYSYVLFGDDHRKFHAALGREMNKAIARVAARLANAGVR